MTDKKLIFNNKNILLSVEESLFNFDLIKNYADVEQVNKKDEFHVTLIGSEVSKNISDIQFIEIKKIAENLDWKFNLKPEYLYISKKYPNGEIRKSIIQLIELPDMEKYYKKISEIIGEEIEVPVPHVTLFTNSTDSQNSLRGIAVYSEKDLETLSPRKIIL